MYSGKSLTPEQISAKVKGLQSLGRFTDALQVIVFLTMGQYLYGNTTVLKSPQWRGFRDFCGGEHAVGIVIIIIGAIGLIGIASLAWTKTDAAYMVITWLFSIAACAWCWTVAGFQTYVLIHDHAGNAGLWNWGLAGAFFLFSRAAITISRGLGSAT